MTRPAVFSNLDFDKALARARSEGKLMVVDATAIWCGPCRMMDRITWSDESVVTWLEARAIAIQIEVPAYPSVAEYLRIEAMPTVIAYNDGVEVDRVVGLQKPAQLIAWLEALTRGVTSLDTLRAAVTSNPNDVTLRKDLARALATAGRLDEATTAYAWLWQHMLEHAPEMAGFGHVFLSTQIAPLLRHHRPAREVFAKLRDLSAPALDRAPDRQTFVEWACLNDALGDFQKTLHWFDTAYKNLPPEQTRELAAAVEFHVGPLLLGANRWRDVWSVYRERLLRWPLRDLAATWSAARRRQRK